jgi:MarR family transcriptional regulator, organic hydroperoxide resistance regulator
MPSRPVPRTVGDRPEAGRPRSSKGAAGAGRKGFAPPLTVSHRELLTSGEDVAFRRSLYLMVLAFSRLQTCREAFGRALGLTGSQFAVLIGTAYEQHDDGVSVRALADHIQLASTHVTTEVGRLIAKGLVVKSVNPHDRRGVLVRLSQRGEAAVREVSAFVRRVNDLLFAGVAPEAFAEVSVFLTRFAANSEDALDEIRRTERRANKPEAMPERPASARAGTRRRGR